MIFIHPDGASEMHEAPAGYSVMDCAVDNGVAGIAAQCGGGCTCSTCHGIIDEDWFDRVGVPVGDEADILEFVPERVPTSRLTCQVSLDESLDGLVVHIPVELPPGDE